MPSPIVQVKDGAGPFTSVTNGKNITPGAAVVIDLVSKDADSWTCTCVSGDDTTDAAAIQSGVVLNTTTKQATLTAPAAGKALIFESKVNGGIGPDGRPSASYTARFALYTPTSPGAQRVVAVNETTEGDSTYGYIKQVNAAIRAIGTGGGSTPTGTGVRKVVAGVENAAASLIVNADVDAAAAIAGSKIVAATTSVPGTMSAADKTKLDGMQPEGAAVAIPALAIDWAAGHVFTKALAAGLNTFTFANATSGRMITVRLTSNAGGSTVAWPTVRWAGGVAPTQSTPSKNDVYTFFHDGTNIYGTVVQDLA